ncbi:PHB depolymerase family esterase [Mesorhizobium sp. LHD-90]|uniref:PHB depolymerase family esterase n=1 Tax=Mesorhizobium sp. LHD-90 TaxID=3071414 RepID=UPI0027DF8255|nr:PHB depolymerase family esterase [Mesorhizobium sp. LHD-90]MDQ6436405.1 PHB depolymerase family esterase [Mesorhizobium sp. LHD-90]
MTLMPATARAQSGPTPGGAQAINSTVFHGEDIKSVTAVTEVFGRSQRTTAAIVEYDAPIGSGMVDANAWTVAGRTVMRAYANDHAEKAAEERDGRFVVLELDPEDDGAVTYAPDVEKPATVVVSQVAPVHAVSGATYAPTETAIINTRQTNLIVDDFQQFRFTDPDTGLLLTYNLYVPKDYDQSKSYPLVLFMHDAGVTGTNPLRTLQQGLGAVSFASPEDQEKHPAFVLAPQYPVAIANDASQISDYPEVTVRLIRDLTTRYSIDEGRLYTTGQSGGCMASIALNIKYPDFFAASLLVAGQWDAAQVAPLANKKLWIIVSQDDAKAYPGMNAIAQVLEQNGAEVTHAVWDGRSDAAAFQNAVETMLNDGSDSNVFYAAFREGTVIPEGVNAGGGSGHVWTWPIAYAIPGVRAWLFEQRK